MKKEGAPNGTPSRKTRARVDERIASDTGIFKVPMAVSERGHDPWDCLDIGYVLSFDEVLVKILRVSRLGGEEVSYMRDEVRVFSISNAIRLQKEGKAKRNNVISFKSTAPGHRDVLWENGAPRRANTTD